MSPNARRRLGAVIFPGFELLDLFGPLEMFDAFAELVPVAGEAGPVRSAQGPACVAEVGFEDAPAFDLLLVPGGIGTRHAVEDPALLEFLRARAPAAEVVMSVCTGAAVLARAGLLDGRRATTNKVFFEVARALGPRVQWVEEARWVEDGPFVTSSGVSAGMDMALAVIARFAGRERAEAVAALTEYLWQDDPGRDPFHRYLGRTDLLARLARVAEVGDASPARRRGPGFEGGGARAGGGHRRVSGDDPPAAGHRGDAGPDEGPPRGDGGPPPAGLSAAPPDPGPTAAAAPAGGRRGGEGARRPRRTP